MTEQDPVAEQEKERGPERSTRWGTRLLPRGEWRLAVLVFVFSGCLAIIAIINGKEFWDWLDLVMVPVILVIVAHQLHAEQQKAQQGAQDEQRDRDREFQQVQHERDQRRAREQWKLEQDLAQQRGEDSALQEYLSQMANLLMEYNLLSLETGAGDPNEWHRRPKAVLARSRTLSVLWQIDAERKRNVIGFLYEARLINREDRLKDDGIVRLAGANLIGAKLRGMKLEGAALNGANLKEAKLGNANLKKANLGGAELHGANLEGAELCGASLREAELPEADLQGADLRGADLHGVCLVKAKLGGLNWRRPT
jgi:hypothetical protein